MSGGWHFWIDRGGTFTDVVARDPDGCLATRKLLSHDPSRAEDAAIAAIRQLLGLGENVAIPAAAVASVKMGTTVGTNALLQRRGAPCVLAVTAGLEDVLEIGDQARPDIFALKIERPEPLYQGVVGIHERVAADGAVVTPLDMARAERDLTAARDRGCRSLAVALLHGDRYPGHEQMLLDLARRLGFSHVSAGHEVNPRIKLVPRGQTTVLDAYLTPVLRGYVERVAASLGGARLECMQSSGGLIEAGRFRGKDSVLSGPAGGVVGAARAADEAGYGKVLTFDMGGTSTDVAHYDGELERSEEHPVGGVRVTAPMLDIHTVAAGGGSILQFDGERLRVGPQSAGADPGPACYRRGGPLTVTDANLLLGRIQPAFFPSIFGPERDAPLDEAAVAEKFTALADKVADMTGQRQSPEALAEGFLRIAVDNMANAIKVISVRRGRDTGDYALCCFGGAGGQHACAVADSLGLSAVLIHPLAGLLSAYGMGLAARRSIREQGVERPLADFDPSAIDDILAPLTAAARIDLTAQGVAGDSIAISRRLRIKYAGSDTTLLLDADSPAALAAGFNAAHRAEFGFERPDTPLVIAAALAEASAEEAGHTLVGCRLEPPKDSSARPAAAARLYLAGQWRRTPVYQRRDLPAGWSVEGPVLLAEENATTLVEPGWTARVRDNGMLILTRDPARPGDAADEAKGDAPKGKAEAEATGAADPARLELFNNLFMFIAEQMGATLARTAHSVNIKERLDFSCALFNGQGRLIANAPHVPVHLGSMGDSVTAIIERYRGGMRAGDAYALNAPDNGGTHLPDVTVVTPVFAADNSGRHAADPDFYLASRGHHADIGGIAPGSMPSDSRTLAEEGVVLDGLKVVDQGRFLEADVMAALAAGPYPARNPAQNLADLQAQIAANERGAADLEQAARAFGLDTVRAYMGHVLDNGAAAIRRVLTRIDDGAFAYRLDDGSEIRIAVTVDRPARRARIDFTGTSSRHPGNFNAPRAVTTACVLYVFRTLVDADIPLNAGCLEPLEIVIPPGSMLDPGPGAAVAAGNVETSQAVANALYGALGVLAGSQGTMNNLTFGDAERQYYETVCGGGGAGRDFAGAAAVHTHMTNSRLTDPEILESRYQVRAEVFARRRGSGGAGRQPGGDGVRRRLRFLQPMRADWLTGNRVVAPFGLDGGEPGRTGANRILRADGRIEDMGSVGGAKLEPGDAIEIETPGGGGFGPLLRS